MLNDLPSCEGTNQEDEPYSEGWNLARGKKFKIVFSMWLILSEQKWVILRDRRGT
jgi:hypothetical protein